MLVIGAGLAASLPLMIGLAGDEALRGPSVLKIVFWYELPILVMTAFLFDYHPKRRALYFWGGAAVIAASLILLYGT